MIRFVKWPTSFRGESLVVRASWLGCVPRTKVSVAAGTAFIVMNHPRPFSTNDALMKLAGRDRVKSAIRQQSTLSVDS